MILHRIKYECRGQQSMLTIWFVVLAAYLISGWVPGVGPLVVAVPLFAFTLAMILVVSVVTADPPAGTEAFWMTRPVRGEALVLSKGLFLGLAVALPWMLVEIAVLLGNGAGAAAFWAVPDFLARRLPWLLAAMAAASLTARMDHTAAVIGLSLLGLGLLAALARLVYDETASFAGAIPGVAASKAPAALVAGAVGWAAVLVYQYRRRRPGRGAAGLALATAAAGIVYLAWPWDLLTPTRPEAGDLAWFEGAPASVDLAAVFSQAHNHTDGRGKTTRYHLYHGPVGLPRVMGAMMAEPRFVDGAFEVEGSAFPYRRRHAWRRNQSWPEDRALKALLDGQGLRGDAGAGAGEDGSPLTDPLFQIPSADLERLAGKTGRYRAEWIFDCFAYREWGEIPLREGARRVAGGISVQVERVAPRYDPVYDSDEQPLGRRLGGCKVTLSDRVPNLSLGAPNPRWLHRAWNGSTLIFLLVNRDRGEVAFPGGTSSNTGAFPVGVQRVQRSTIVFDIPLAKGAPEGAGERWLERASVLVVERQFLGRRSKQVAVEGFQL